MHAEDAFKALLFVAQQAMVTTGQSPMSRAPWARTIMRPVPTIWKMSLHSPTVAFVQSRLFCCCIHISHSPPALHAAWKAMDSNRSGRQVTREERKRLRARKSCTGRNSRT